MITQERLTAHRHWLENLSGKGRLVAVAEDLSGADLSGACLSSADLSGANLSGANLRGADLRDADLRSANFIDANLSGADLSSADLSDADIRGADLRCADLSSANLRNANLSSANLLCADLRRANLRDANLSSAKGYRCPSEWVAAQEVDPEGRGIIVYKQFGLHYQAPAAWRIEPGAVITEAVNPDRGTECGSGINVAPRDWDGFDNAKTLWRLLIEWRDLCTLVVPLGPDRKARVGRATILGEVER